jgi:hypothetical protein
MRMAPDPAVKAPQDLTIEVADGRGRTVRTAVSAVSAALRPLPGSDNTPRLPRTLLRTVRLPLSRLTGLNLRDIRSITLHPRTAEGSTYLADVMFVRPPSRQPMVRTLPAVSLEGAPTMPEGNAGVTYAMFTAVLSRPSVVPVSVLVTAVPEIPAFNDPYWHSRTTVVPRYARRLTVPAGRTRVPVRIPVHGNPRNGLWTPFTVALSAPHDAVLGQSVVRGGTVLEDDPEPTASVENVRVREGQPIRIPVRLSAASDLGLRVIAHVTDGTAKEGSDFVVPIDDPFFDGHLLDIPPMVDRAFFEFTGVQDRVKERTESFTVDITVDEESQGTVGKPSRATITIVDDD